MSYKYKYHGLSDSAQTFIVTMKLSLTSLVIILSLCILLSECIPSYYGVYSLIIATNNLILLGRLFILWGRWKRQRKRKEKRKGKRRILIFSLWIITISWIQVWRWWRKIWRWIQRRIWRWMWRRRLWWWLWWSSHLQNLWIKG